MSFLTWAALGVAALVVAPLIAHLLRRRPPEELPFAATKLVPARTAVAQRRTAIEDRALFAIRALSVLALAVLGATPFITCQRLSLAREGGASVALTIIVDDSMSMRAEVSPGGGVTRLARAKEAAGELLAGLQEGDAVAIVLAGGPARVALAATTNLDAARELVAGTAQTDRGTDLDGAVQLFVVRLPGARLFHERARCGAERAQALRGVEEVSDLGGESGGLIGEEEVISRPASIP